jgi:hypothetical protein
VTAQYDLFFFETSSKGDHRAKRLRKRACDGGHLLKSVHLDTVQPRGFRASRGRRLCAAACVAGYRPCRDAAHHFARKNGAETGPKPFLAVSVGCRVSATAPFGPGSLVTRIWRSPGAPPSLHALMQSHHESTKSSPPFTCSSPCAMRPKPARALLKTCWWCSRAASKRRRRCVSVRSTVRSASSS